MGLFNNTTEYGPPASDTRGAHMPPTHNPSIKQADMHPHQKRAAKKGFRWIVWVVIGYTFFGGAVKSLVKWSQESRMEAVMQQVHIDNDEFSADIENQIQEKIRQDLADQGITIPE